MKSEYRDKLKETLGEPSSRLGGTDPEGSTTQTGRAPLQLDGTAATASGARIEATSNATGGSRPAERMAATTDTIAYRQRQQGAQRAEQAEVVAGREPIPTTATPSLSQRTKEEPTRAAAATAVAGRKTAGATGPMTTNEEHGWGRDRGGIGKVVQLTAAFAAT